jgi:hypothetical protein
VQRAARQPGDDERALLGERRVDVRGGQPVAAGPDRQARGAQVLRLDGEQALDDGDGRRGPLGGQQLRGRPRTAQLSGPGPLSVGNAGAT